MAIIILYNFFHPQTPIFDVLFINHSLLLWVILNTNTPLGFTLLKLELQSTITAFCGLLKYVQMRHLHKPQ